jgi:hypothetical protein
LMALPEAISPLLDFCPTQVFKFWWVFPSIWVSLYVLLWSMKARAWWETPSVH